MHLFALKVLACLRSESDFLWECIHLAKLIVFTIALSTDIESKIRIAFPARELPGARSVLRERTWAARRIG